ncbi:MAG: formate dehydrogenase accessory sulfurtransferase FdhD [Verrucomicrobiota bacterium]
MKPNRTDDIIPIQRFKEGEYQDEKDYVAAEEPLEIRVNGQSVAVMMRTPGFDEELVTGFLFTESLIKASDEIDSVHHLPDLDRESVGNTIEVKLSSEPDLTELTRHVFTSSSCGVCGKATIDSVFQQFPPLNSVLQVEPDLILGLPSTLRAAQETFEKTGGLHASALFSSEGELLVLREDVGRHNALDKVIGMGLQEGLDFSEVILLVSGRISFELTQKALAAGISVIAGISAPTSLAVGLAAKSGQTLIGFLREKGFNRYA